MAKNKEIQNLEAEYDEPIYDIIVGFAEMGYTMTATAEILGLNRDTVRLWLVKTNTPNPFRHGNVGRPRSPWANCRVNGMTIYELAEYYSVGLPTITRWLKKGKLKCETSRQSSKS